MPGRLARVKRDVLMNVVLASPLVPLRVRAGCLRRLGMQVGAGATVRPMCFFGGADVYIGQGTFVNYKCFFDNAATIRIGANCTLAMEVMLCTAAHTIGEPERRTGDNVPAAIDIGDGCWLGTRCIIMPGVSVGNGCVIGAGAVVTKDCDANGVYAGMPAKRIRDL